MLILQKPRRANGSNIAGAVTDLQISRQGHVDLLSIWSDAVEQEGVVQRAVPHCLKAVESPEGKNHNMFSSRQKRATDSHSTYFYEMLDSQILGFVCIQQRFIL